MGPDPRHANLAVGAVRQGIESVSKQSGRSAPSIRIGALPTVSVRLMPEAMALFLSEDMPADIKIVTGENAVLLEQLRSDALDLVVGRLAAPETMTGFFFEHLYSEKVVFAMRRDHPLLAEKSDVLGRLGEFCVLMPTRASIIRPFADRFLISRGVPNPPVQIETVSDGFGRAFLRNSDAVWIISEGVVAKDVLDGNIAVLDLDTADTRGAVGLTMRTEMPMTPPFEILVKCIRAAASAIAAKTDRG